MSLQDIIPFGPVHQTTRMSNREVELKKITNCTAPSMPDSSNSIQYSSDSNGDLVVILTVQAKHIVSVELCDARSFDYSRMDAFLGWLMPSRPVNNSELANELILRTSKLTQPDDNLNGLGQIKCCWLAGSSENCSEHEGEVVFEFSRVGSGANVAIKATYHRSNMI